MRTARRVGQEGGERVRRALTDKAYPGTNYSETMTSYHLDHLQHLETEAIHIMREVAGEFERSTQ